MPKKILIIDDEEDMRIYLQTLLRKAGYETEIAVNGRDALSKLPDINPDLITLDILMPQKSGLNFFQSIRGQNESKVIPVIVLSGVTSHQEFFDKEKLEGPTIFVEKPINADDFLSRVKEMLGE